MTIVMSMGDDDGDDADGEAVKPSTRCAAEGHGGPAQLPRRGEPDGTRRRLPDLAAHPSGKIHSWVDPKFAS
jgi:hypothetical protein